MNSVAKEGYVNLKHTTTIWVAKPRPNAPNCESDRSQTFDEFIVQQLSVVQWDERKFKLQTFDFFKQLHCTAEDPIFITLGINFQEGYRIRFQVIASHGI